MKRENKSSASLAGRSPPWIPVSGCPLDRVDLIRKQFDRQRQLWNDRVERKCAKSHGSLESLDSDEAEESCIGCHHGMPAKATLRLVASDHVTTFSGTTFHVTYDIQDFLRHGSVEVRCSPEGVVVVADVGLPSRKIQQTFMIANVDYSSLRVRTHANGMLHISVTSRKMVRAGLKRQSSVKLSD